MSDQMNSLSHPAQKALSAITRHGRLVYRTHKGLPVWYVGRKGSAFEAHDAWVSAPDLGTFMPSAVRELVDRGLVVWDGADRLRPAQ